MDLASKQSHLPFLTAKARMKSRWDITMSDDDFIEGAYYIWRQIGNIARTVNVFTFKVDDSLIIPLPKDCEFVQSVTGVYLRSYTDKGNFDSGGRVAEVETNLTELSPASDAKTSSSYTYGESISFVTGDGFVKLVSVNTSGYEVEVKYNAILTGEDGLPLLNDREVEAIAANMALREIEKKIFRGTKVTEYQLQYIKNEADRLFQAAAIDEKISDAAIDAMMDVKISWDRKSYGDTLNHKY